jgi:hypothetical protein
MFDHDHTFGHRVWCEIIVEPKEILEPKKNETFKLVSSQHPEQQVIYLRLQVNKT